MTKPKVVICDLDGTLSLFEKIDKTQPHYRNPYNASTCDNDLLNTVVADIIKDRQVILVSGREHKYLEPTLKFLQKHNIQFIEIFMRQTADNRKDSIVKKEIYEKHIKPNYEVHFVLDDRNQVVEMWRSLGLTCLQVADGNF
jgi:hydroxymethylpyrimidine pyrophosphatase-like HAD family hydrolase